MSGLKWSRKTTSNIAEQLNTLGIAVSGNTVGRLLKEMGYRLRVNRKQIASTKNPDRNQQFLYIGQHRERFAVQGLPIISVDAQKKELIGNFKNTGAKWDREPIPVKDHDFRSEAKALVTPYGIYDTQANRGSVFLGTSHDTPAFTVDAIARWWRQEGCKRYPEAREIFILADGGGQQRLALPRLEKGDSRHHLHSNGSHRYCQPLPARRFQMESYRTPPVQPDQ